MVYSIGTISESDLVISGRLCRYFRLAGGSGLHKFGVVEDLGPKNTRNGALHQVLKPHKQAQPLALHPTASIDVSMYLPIHPCMSVHTHISIYTYMHIYIYIYVYICIYIHTHILHMYIYMYTYNPRCR